MLKSNLDFFFTFIGSLKEQIWQKEVQIADEENKNIITNEERLYTTRLISYHIFHGKSTWR